MTLKTTLVALAIAAMAAPAIAQPGVMMRPPAGPVRPPVITGRPSLPGPASRPSMRPGQVYDSAGQLVVPTGGTLTPGTTPEGTLRCTKEGDRALVHNVGQTTLPAGTRFEIPVVGGGEGVMNIPAPMAPGSVYLSEIRYPADFTSCEVHILPSAMMPGA